MLSYRHYPVANPCRGFVVWYYYIHFILEETGGGAQSQCLRFFLQILGYKQHYVHFADKTVETQGLTQLVPVALDGSTRDLLQVCLTLHPRHHCHSALFPSLIYNLMQINAFIK